MPRSFGRAFLTIVVTGVFISCASAQPLESSLQGHVFDPSGAAIIGAAITAVANDGTGALSIMSDGAGQFMLLLPPGKYTVRISVKGFLDKSQEVEIGNAPASFDFTLALPELSETVQVTVTPGYQVSTISSATKAQDTAWAPGAWTRGNTLRFNVDSVTTIQRVTIAFWVRKT
jgi:hypothetical protein